MVLMPLLASMFPFYMSDVYVLQCYIDNLLQLSTYLPKSRVHILRTVFVELTKIDVSYDTSFYSFFLVYHSLLRYHFQICGTAC